MFLNDNIEAFIVAFDDECLLRVINLRKVTGALCF